MTLQGDNGRLEVWLEGCDTFEVVPSRVLNEATLIVRVKNSSALDYEVVQNISCQVRHFQRTLSKDAVFHSVDLVPSIFDVNYCISCLCSDTQKMYNNTVTCVGHHGVFLDAKTIFVCSVCFRQLKFKYI